MKTLGAFFKLIRWPNLFFIALTQCLFYYAVFASLAPQGFFPVNHFLFALLVLASVVIAAAGYIINDYFDVQIDAVNKPGRIVIDKQVKRRWAILWHWLLSGLGLLLSVYISYRLKSWIIITGNLFSVLLLWFYSTTFKKRILSGNIIIASLTAWVILVVYFFTRSLLDLYGQIEVFDDRKFFKFTILYAGFAFIVSIIREVIKDMEDVEGDQRFNCRTMPIAWGIPASKVFTAVWMVVCIAVLVIVQLYAWQLGWWPIIVYTVALVIVPLLFLLRNLYKAATATDFHRQSTRIKFVMLAGILSMLFFIF